MTSRSNIGQAVGLALAAAALVAAGPCDEYAAGDTPCVAAHSTTRALYSDYDGVLYQVTRESDGTTADISASSAGGVADSASQDSFCADTTCTITTIYDQSGNGNILTPAPPGGAASGPGPDGYDLPADATAAPVSLNGTTVYGVLVTPGVGYRNNEAVGTATGDGPQGMYAVFDGTNYNDGTAYLTKVVMVCC